MTEIFKALLEFVMLGIGIGFISGILTIISIPLGKRAKSFLSILFIALPFIGDLSWRAYLLGFFMLFFISFTLVGVFNFIFRR